MSAVLPVAVFSGPMPVGDSTSIVPVALGASALTISFDRSNWTDPAALMTVRIDLSIDGGITWSPDPSGQATWPWGMFPIKMTSSGGLQPVDQIANGLPNITGNVAPFALPDTTNPNRQIRLTASVNGNPVAAPASVTVN